MPKNLISRLSLSLAAPLLLVAVIACSDPASVPTPTQAVPSPTAEPPGGVQAAPVEMRLRGVTLPDDAESVRALFDRLPAQIGDMQLANTDERGPDRYASFYFRPGSALPNVQLIVLDVSTGDFFPADSTASDVIELFKSGADWTVTGSGSEEGLVWVEYNTTASTAGGVTQQVYALQWGRPDSRWVFGMQVEDPAHLVSVLDTFLTAIRGGTP
ncbi:MAG: hypothetical protein FJ317_00895 [SAR202 cluster bacterium]|nr:hypothetical protein [SAR202 cluster bacterium]